MIQLVSLAFGAFQAAEAFHSAFRPGHPKMCLTVDVGVEPEPTDTVLHDRLLRAFPALVRHDCHALRPDQEAEHRARRGVLLMDEDPAANRAHLLEHLMLEMLSQLDDLRRLSGVTCAYVSPRERCDIFVECAEPQSGSLVALLAIEAMNEALAGAPLEPRYPDMVACARALRRRAPAPWLATGLAEATGLSAGRAADALEGLSRVRVVTEEPYSMNFSGEPIYRFVGVGGSVAGEGSRAAAEPTRASA